MGTGAAMRGAGIGGLLIAHLLLPRRLEGQPFARLSRPLKHNQAASGFCRTAAFGKKEHPLQVLVRDNNVDQALKALKKKMQREGIFREMKLRGHYEKPSEKKARQKAEAVRRARKLARKKLQREGLLPMKPKVIPGAGGPGGRDGGRGPRPGGFGGGGGFSGGASRG
jgi:small subunit ribosomal protein S21